MTELDKTDRKILSILQSCQGGSGGAAQCPEKLMRSDKPGIVSRQGSCQRI